MKRRLPSPRAIALPGALLAAAGLAACGSALGKSTTARHGRTPARAASQSPSHPSASPSNPSASGSAPCGPAAAGTLADTIGTVAQRIYANELASSEVRADKRQVETFGPLLSALESGNRPAIKQAVETLVFSHTHVVRLRVSRGSEVLADVGGPYILAPVSGTLRRSGRTLGRYVLSVQDDSGYVKLVDRFIGVRLMLRAGSRTLPVEGALTGALPPGAPTFSFDARAYPAGPLRISLLIPVPTSLSRLTCAQVKVAELGDVAQRVSRRFALSPATFGPYVRATQPLTGGLLFIRAGSRQLAGSQSGPPSLPDVGTVRYRGYLYGVSSFTTGTSIGPVRVYQLIRQ